MGDLFLVPNETVAVSESDGGVVVRFIAPKARNPISTLVLEYLNQVCSMIESDDRFREVVFTGSGNAFASGADLNEICTLTVENARQFSIKGQSVLNRIAALPIRTVAAINGFCYGGGVDLALACDERIASSNSTFCHPGAGLGIITGWGGTQRLTRLVGEANALELFFTATPFDAPRALAIGLIDAIDDEAVLKFASSKK